jgi:deazaflavin-dependent oxidoreductase (nitroreductase family)
MTIRLARSGHGRFSLIRHVGRKSGRPFETPVILARLGPDFVAELTYGPQVQWYKNIVAAGGCVVVYEGQEYAVDAIEPCSAQAGLDAYGKPESLILKLLKRTDFRLLHTIRESSPNQSDQPTHRRS